MQIQDQVSNLELSQKLEKLGVKQDSIWWWVATDDKKFFLSRTTEYISDIKYPFVYSAFTVAEHGEGLPVMIKEKTHSSKKGEEIYKKYWENGERTLHSVGYATFDHRIILQEFDETEANARAKMRIYLIENGLIKP